MGIFKFAIEAFLSSKSVAQQRIEEYNEDAWAPSPGLVSETLRFRALAQVLDAVLSKAS